MKIEDAIDVLLEAASLCGYASSMPEASTNVCGDPIFAHTDWRKGLMEHVERTRSALDKFWQQQKTSV